jgi:16S rRNA (adenine1518-N6/adenine1519-N6)-dimethyltransferase
MTKKNTRKGGRTGARLGQHFLTGTWAATSLVKATGMKEGDIVLEIGPGKGALTKEILKTDAHVVAIEKDEALADLLAAIFSKEILHKQLEIVRGDVRDLEPGKIGLRAGEYILAANIPYYITGEIIRQFLSCDTQPHTMAILIQKEVAERIIARDGKESILSIAVKAYGNPKIFAKVSRGNFSPPPSVDSAILVVTDISKSSFDELSEELFFRVLRAGFAAKRKLLASNLGNVFGREKVDAAFTKCKIPEKARAEDLDLGDWLTLVGEM